MSHELAPLLLNELRARFSERNVPTALSEGSHLTLFTPALEIHIHTVALHHELPGTDSISAVFDVRFPGGSTPSVCVLAVGHGQSTELAARDTVEQWCAGVLPVIVNWLLGAPKTDGVTKARMIVRHEDSAHRFGWSVRLGPIIQRIYARPGTAHSVEEIVQNSFFLRVVDALHPHAAHQSLMWLECFAWRSSDSRMLATARLSNQDWDEGKRVLLSWAAEWPGRTCSVSRRQFLLFEPVPAESVESAVTLDSPLYRFAHKKPSWWRRLFGGGNRSRHRGEPLA
jgi:Family of unknown function (DUF6348)